MQQSNILHTDYTDYNNLQQFPHPIHRNRKAGVPASLPLSFRVPGGHAMASEIGRPHGSWGGPPGPPERPPHQLYGEHGAFKMVFDPLLVFLSAAWHIRDITLLHPLPTLFTSSWFHSRDLQFASRFKCTGGCTNCSNCPFQSCFMFFQCSELSGQGRKSDVVWNNLSI